MRPLQFDDQHSDWSESKATELSEHPLKPHQQSTQRARQVLQHKPITIVVVSVIVLVPVAWVFWVLISQGDTKQAAVWGCIPIVMTGLFEINRRSVKYARVLVRSLPPGCLACTYDLSGIVAADDGCTVCPECGAAWRFPMFPEKRACRL